MDDTRSTEIDRTLLKHLVWQTLACHAKSILALSLCMLRGVSVLAASHASALAKSLA